MKIPEIEALRARTAQSPLPAVLVAVGDAGVREGVVQVLADDLKARGAALVEVTRLEFDNEKARDAYDRLGQLAGQPPMFGDAVVVVVDHRAPAVVPDELKAFLASPAPHVRLAVWADRKAEKSGLARLVREAGGEVVALKDLEDRDAAQAATDEARSRGLRLTPRAASALVDLVGTDRGAIGSAIEALDRYKGGSGEVGEDDLVGLVRRTRKDVPWALDDAVAARDLRRTLKVTQRRLQDDPNLLPILHSLVRVARRILQAKDLVARRVPPEEAQKALGIAWPFQWDRLREAQARYTEEELAAFLRDVPRLEVLAKRGHASAESLLTAVVTGLLGRAIEDAQARGR